MGISDGYLATFGLHRDRPRADDPDAVGWLVCLRGGSDAQEEDFARLALARGAIKTMGGIGWLGACFPRRDAPGAETFFEQAGARFRPKRVTLERLRADFTRGSVRSWRR